MMEMAVNNCMAADLHRKCVAGTIRNVKSRLLNQLQSSFNLVMDDVLPSILWRKKLDH